MIREVWARLRPLLPPRARAAGGLIALESLVAGFLEAMLLVLVVSVALAVADGADIVHVALPFAGKVALPAARALGIAAGAGIVMLILHVHTARLASRVSAGVLRTAREHVIRAFAGATWARQSQDREGALQETVSTLAGGTSSLVMSLSNLTASALGLLVLLGAAFAVDPVVTLVVLLFGSIIFFALRPVARLTRSQAREWVAANSQLTEEITKWTSLAMELRVFGVEDVEAGRLEDQNTAAAAALERSRFTSHAGTDLFRDLAVLFLVGAVAALRAFGSVDLSAVGAVVLLIVRSLSYAQMTNAAMQSINELTPHLDSFTERIASLDDARERRGSREVDDITGITFDAVGYDYEVDRPGVEAVALEIRAGEAIGVVGPSGGGKSTLVQILLRLRPPTRGQVVVSGIPYQEIADESWHRLVALVPQEPRLFEGSVADNISFWREGITRADIEGAARDAQVIEDIEALPDGLDTALGPRGLGLSGGQRQRVAIARALVGRPRLLVLDEPTSALDARSEHLLQRTINDLKGRVTLVIIAHRMATLACCDRVVAMEAGRVKRVGTLAEAIADVSLEDLAEAQIDAP